MNLLETSPTISIDIIFEEGGIWWSTNITLKEFFTLLDTGKIKGKPIAACRFEMRQDGGITGIPVIHDFTLRANGISAWRTGEYK